MKKSLVILFLLVSFSGLSQTRIFIGQTTRTIYTFYKEQGYNIGFYNYKQVGGISQYLILLTDDYKVTFYYNEKTNICYSQTLEFFNKESYFKACDAYKISDVYKESKVVINNKKYRIVTMQVPSAKVGMSDMILINKI
ncbi:hypothetical protein [Flavobacterium sedimenticola]|uniref:Uncharacterized protein n=1 Tax=Flavobacterium sedimenticola TaxID=3043286 RepID=A0ABT6XRI7_9FLAO|nr:hypothetical protein [Flavobacterium sedimenticola]MDI9257269.1 hypothetical protein [Flavobacterium sedimenticola]